MGRTEPSPLHCGGVGNSGRLEMTSVSLKVGEREGGHKDKKRETWWSGVDGGVNVSEPLTHTHRGGLSGFPQRRSPAKYNG